MVTHKAGPARLSMRAVIQLDRKLFGADTQQHSPQLFDDCLVHDGQYYHRAQVIGVQVDTFSAAYIDSTETVCIMAGIPKRRFRPVVR